MAIQEKIRQELGVSLVRARLAEKIGFIPSSFCYDEMGVFSDSKYLAAREINKRLRQDRLVRQRERLRTVLENKRRKSPQRNAPLDYKTSGWWQLYVAGDPVALSDPNHNRAQLFRRQFRVPWTFFNDLVSTIIQCLIIFVLLSVYFKILVLIAIASLFMPFVHYRSPRPDLTSGFHTVRNEMPLVKLVYH
jgi:hypothetical protein